MLCERASRVHFMHNLIHWLLLGNVEIVALKGLKKLSHHLTHLLNTRALPRAKHVPFGVVVCQL